MPVRIAIPEPTTTDAAYNARSLPPYLSALESAGAVPLVIPAQERQDEVARMLTEAQGILLPGSGFDVNPESYGEARSPECGPQDPGRTAIDELLLQDAFNLHKPILAICHGAQTLNVWRNGSLMQDLETVLKTPVNHRPGRDVVNAHPIHIASGSRLAAIAHATSKEIEGIVVDYCNSSHHQAIARIGDNLRVTAVSPQDQVIEAVELDSPDHFVMGVQWHPERTLTVSPLSLAIFAAFVRAVEAWRPRNLETSVARA
ncbi:MAG TPA: gamma-glutamyl-gamma-aminobutyrate hydrolase family protein [Terracidiphilus sp.]